MNELREMTLSDVVALSNDHKPYQAVEMKRIIDAGGHVKNNRVNAELAVSRSLGDLSFKADPDLPSHKQMVSN
jgi:serine/threonine protein phosphatase PrpC